MNRDERIKKHLQRLEESQARTQERLNAARQRTEERLEAQQRRVDERFERLRQRNGLRNNTPNDQRQRIIQAALELLQTTDLDSLSLRKLASTLDMQAPALYWYFDNKEALIDYMAEAILQTTLKDLQPRTADEPWQDWLVEVMKKLRSAMLAYPDGGRVVAGAHFDPAITLMKLFEVAMESLTSAGVEMRRANLITSTAVHFVFGNVIEQQASPSIEELQQIDLDKWFKDYPFIAKGAKQSYEDALNGYDEFEDAVRLIIGYAKPS